MFTYFIKYLALHKIKVCVINVIIIVSEISLEIELKKDFILRIQSSICEYSLQIVTSIRNYRELLHFFPEDTR